MLTECVRRDFFFLNFFLRGRGAPRFGQNLEVACRIGQKPRVSIFAKSLREMYAFNILYNKCPLILHKKNIKNAYYAL